MKISRILEQHISAIDPMGLANNLGDSYLCLHNPIFRNIRRATIKYNYKYSNQQNDDYQALPLSQLATILSTKVIPYLDNVSVLKQVEKQMPGGAVWDDVSDNLRKNFLFHESCHAVARVMSHEIKNEDKILNMLIEESFANTCELLAVVKAGESSHRVFYEWNSYTALFEAKTNLKKAEEELGREILFKIIFFGYLHSNYLFDHVDERQLARILKIITQQVISPKQIKTIKALLKICFTLDPRFKEVTTRFYMRLNDVNISNEKFKNFSYFENFEQNSNYRSYVDNLILVVTAE